MSLTSIHAQSNEVLNCYHQKLSWKIREDNWISGERLHLLLETKIPGSWENGGYVIVDRKFVGLMTVWPKNLDPKKVSVEALITIKMDNGSSVAIKCDQNARHYFKNVNTVETIKFVKLDAELLYDVERCFTIEAEVKVTQVQNNAEEDSKKITKFVKDIQSIIDDEKNSDVVVIAENEKFYCHKNILSARSDVFKNMLDNPNFIESESNIIEVKEVRAEAVGSMLRYIYSGEVPEDTEELTVDLLNVAEMYLLNHLKEACLNSLMKRLNVSSCISNLIMVDRYTPSDGNFREMVIMFMKCKVEELVETEDWDKLVDKHPALAKDLMRAIAKGSKEKHKCRFCVVSFGK